MTITVKVLWIEQGAITRTGKLGPIPVDKIYGVLEPDDPTGYNLLIMENGQHYHIKDFSMSDLLKIRIQQEKQKFAGNRN